MNSGGCIATRDVKGSTSCRAHTCGLKGLGERRLASPMGLGSHVESPSLEWPRTALPKPPLLPFPLVISDLTHTLRAPLRGAGGSHPAGGCKADLRLSLEETCGSADATDGHPACSRLHATRGLSRPCA